MYVCTKTFVRFSYYHNMRYYNTIQYNTLLLSTIDFSAKILHEIKLRSWRGP